MKKLFLGIAAFAMLSTPVLAAGWLYSDTVEPSALPNQVPRTCRVGKATCDSYLGLVQLGDCSYDTAMRNGKISFVNHADTYTKGWFFFKHITTKVYGE